MTTFTLTGEQVSHLSNLIDRAADDFAVAAADPDNGYDEGEPSGVAEFWRKTEDLRAALDRQASDPALVVCATALTIAAEAIITQAAPGGGGLTCTEANALEEAYRRIGDSDTADNLHEAHILSDCDTEDEHHAEYLDAQARTIPATEWGDR